MNQHSVSAFTSRSLYTNRMLFFSTATPSFHFLSFLEYLISPTLAHEGKRPPLHLGILHCGKRAVQFAVGRLSKEIHPTIRWSCDIESLMKRVASSLITKAVQTST